MQINELDKVKDDIDQTEQGEYERLAKPTNLMTGYAYRAGIADERIFQRPYGNGKCSIYRFRRRQMVENGRYGIRR